MPTFHRDRVPSKGIKALKNRVKTILATAACVAGLALPAAAEFRIGFKWGNIPLCTTGNPNVVESPAFTVRDLPAGTTSIQFRLKDVDVPGYNHGSSKRIPINRDGTVPKGAFTYKSPCPPNGAHTYEWQATARNGGKVTGKATARRKYPE